MPRWFSIPAPAAAVFPMKMQLVTVGLLFLRLPIPPPSSKAMLPLNMQLAIVGWLSM